MNRYKGKTAQWQQQNKEEQKMNKTEFIKVRCTLEEKQRIKSKAESAGRKFSDYCREILLNGKVTAVPKMTENEREAIAILQHTGRFYGQISNLIKVKDERWVHITQNRYCPIKVCKLQSSYICSELKNQRKNNEAYKRTKIGINFRNGLKRGRF